jgi:hypothetical protein
MVRTMPEISTATCLMRDRRTELIRAGSTFTQFFDLGRSPGPSPSFVCRAKWRRKMETKREAHADAEAAARRAPDAQVLHRACDQILFPVGLPTRGSAARARCLMRRLPKSFAPV